MEIRNLRIKDYEDMVKLWSRAKLPFKPNGRDSKEAIEAQMKENPEFFLGAFEGSRLIGVVIISCDMRKGWINRLAVDPEYRLRGVAQALIAESEKILRKHGIKIFCALIEDYNVASKKLFKKLGYVEHRDIIYFSKRENEEV
ncbi:MAG: GNAT family N-acetyltransferase [Candidatus Bathyarchaeia archaeon]